MNKFSRRGKHGLTIEYAVVMMALSVAFVSLVLITAQLYTKNAATYQNYAERKQMLDEIAVTYIQNQGAQGCLDAFVDNPYNYFWRVCDKSDLIVLQGDYTQNFVVLRVQLDAQGNVTLLRYGV